MPKLEDEIKTLFVGQRDEIETELLNIMKKSNPYQFETIIGDLLEKMGYMDIEVTARYKDGGIDVIGAFKNGITEMKIAVQVKRWKRNIGREVIDALRGSLHRCGANLGVIITTSDFTKDAEENVNPINLNPIMLINGAELVNLFLKYQIGIKDNSIRYFSIDENYWNVQMIENMEDDAEDIYPQANKIDKIIDTVEVIGTEYKTTREIGDYLKVVGRQAFYYCQAAKYLGFIEKKNGKFKLTSLGKSFINATSKDRSKILREAMLETKIINSFIRYLKSKNKPLPMKDIFNYIERDSGLSRSTAERRAQSLVSWAIWSKVISKSSEGFVLNSGKGHRKLESYLSVGK